MNHHPFRITKIRKSDNCGESDDESIDTQPGKQLKPGSIHREIHLGDYFRNLWSAIDNNVPTYCTDSEEKANNCLFAMQRKFSEKFPEFQLCQPLGYDKTKISQHSYLPDISHLLHAEVAGLILDEERKHIIGGKDRHGKTWRLPTPIPIHNIEPGDYVQHIGPLLVITPASNSVGEKLRTEVDNTSKILDSELASEVKIEVKESEAATEAPPFAPPLAPPLAPTLAPPKAPKAPPSIHLGYTGEHVQPFVNTSRNDLLSSIQGGVTLKKVQKSAPPPEDMLSKIKAGVPLKHVEVNQNKQKNAQELSEEDNTIGSVLTKAMAKRKDTLAGIVANKPKLSQKQQTEEAEFTDKPVVTVKPVQRFTPPTLK